jgi:H+/Cl- antiporter ClcA
MVRSTNVIEKSFMSSNIIILALFYTLFGAVLSYMMYHLFDEFDEHWRNRSNVFQLTDVGI